MRYKYSKEDIEFLEKHYPLGEWNNIHKRFPQLTKHAIQSKMHKLGVTGCKDGYKRNHGKNKSKWSKEELEILANNYSKVPMSDMINLLSSRSKNSIIIKANELKIPSYNKRSALWKTHEIEYLINNWELCPDKSIANSLSRTFRSVKAKREELGLYRQDLNSNSYPTLAKYLRGKNQTWKKNSMQLSNYKCVFTGDKDFEIHHLYGVSNIIEDIHKKYNINKKESLSDYSDIELSFILQKFQEIQKSYPLGVCVKKSIHVLFHSMYGQYYNTPSQWCRFVRDYKEGKYNQFINQ